MDAGHQPFVGEPVPHADEKRIGTRLEGPGEKNDVHIEGRIFVLDLLGAHLERDRQRSPIESLAKGRSDTLVVDDQADEHCFPVPGPPQQTLRSGEATCLGRDGSPIFDPIDAITLRGFNFAVHSPFHFTQSAGSRGIPWQRSSASGGSMDARSNPVSSTAWETDS